jgi:hypothetical protein
LTSTTDLESRVDDLDTRVVVLEQQVQFEKAQRAGDYLRLQKLETQRVDLLLELRVLKAQLAIYAGLGALIGGALMHLTIDALSTFFHI